MIKLCCLITILCTLQLLCSIKGVNKLLGNDIMYSIIDIKWYKHFHSNKHFRMNLSDRFIQIQQSEILAQQPQLYRPSVVPQPPVAHTSAFLNASPYLSQPLLSDQVQSQLLSEQQSVEHQLKQLAQLQQLQKNYTNQHYQPMMPQYPYPTHTSHPHMSSSNAPSTFNNTFINPQAFPTMRQSPEKTYTRQSTPTKKQSIQTRLNPKTSVRQSEQRPVKPVNPARESTRKPTIQDRLGRTINERLSTVKVDNRGKNIQDRLGKTIQDRLGKTITERLGKTMSERLGKTLDERIGKKPISSIVKQPTAKIVKREKAHVEKSKAKPVASSHQLDEELDSFMCLDPLISLSRLDSDITDYMKGISLVEGSFL